MKKYLIIVFLLSVISCTPLISHEYNTPAFTFAIKSSTITTTSTEVPPTHHFIPTTIFKPISTSTILPEITVTEPVFDLIQKEFNPSEWKILFDINSVRQIELGSEEQMWIVTGDQIGYFDGINWVLNSKKDYGLATTVFDMAIATDGTVWVVDQQAISHYEDGLWNVYSIPDAPGYNFPSLAIDSSNLVWLALAGCKCGNSIRIFDGTNWDEQWLWSMGNVEATQLLFNSDGTLWASFGPLFWNSDNIVIGQYTGKTWKKYSGIDLWPGYSFSDIQITSDSKGNIFGITDGQVWIAKIDRDENISKVPFDFINYRLETYRMRLFIDKQDRIWTNACYKDTDQGCLAYYQNKQWISFRNLPFDTMLDMNELLDGSLLVATTQGLFQYKPAN